MNKPAEVNLEEHALAEAEHQEQQENSFLYAATSQTPWWVISILLHGLVITLAGLMTMAIEMPEKESPVVHCDFIEPIKQLEAKPEPQNVEFTPDSPFNATSTDPTGRKPERDLKISADLIKIAELSTQIETYNPDLPDKHSAVGTPDSSIMHSVSGDPSKAGGGDGFGVTGAVLDDSIGFGGDGSRGNTGGFGDKPTGGKGFNYGPGTGTFGYGRNGGGKLRLLRTCGGDPKESVLRAALQWLSYHQEADGHWDAKKYGASVKTDTAVTGLALLTFLGAGHTEKVGDYHNNVRSAVAWLKSKQDASGLIWDTTDDGARHRAKGYPGAIATLALVEAAGMANDPDTKRCAQLAIDYCTEVHQNGQGSDKLGWRYGPNEAADMSVSGWYIMALKSAKIAGLHVNPQAFDGALKFLTLVEHKIEGGSSYAPISQFWYMPGEEHGSSSHRLTAIGTLARQFLGWKADELQSSVDWFVNKGGVPEYGAAGESVDLYYWYYGSMCVYQQGPHSELWKRWNVAMKRAIGEHQCKNGDDLGSFDPVGDFSGEWGRVGQTALNALCMEVYYRYELMGQ